MCKYQCLEREREKKKKELDVNTLSDSGGFEKKFN
jgi:hypothetical protein